MYRKITDFATHWQEEVDMTVLLFQGIDFDKKAEKFNDNVRSLERLVWHICQTVTEMGHRGGIFETEILEHATCPDTIDEVISIYKNYANQLKINVLEHWKDEDLDIEIPMYGETWTKGKMLSVLVLHQTHHRGQLTVVMRTLGMKVAGLYGPAKEDWAKYGMPTME
jgi:uncharacterized damage-inducible protein DinB